MDIHTYPPQSKLESWLGRVYKVQSNLIGKYFEGHTESVLLIRGRQVHTYLLSVLVDIVYMS